MGSFMLPMLLFFATIGRNYCKLFSFFHFFGRLPLETEKKISYNALVYA
jgi:hypothetical protein